MPLSADFHSTESVVLYGRTVAVNRNSLPKTSGRLLLYFDRLIEIAGTETLTIQDSDTSPLEAVIMEVPPAKAVTTPSWTVATDSFEDDQKTLLSVASEGLTVAIMVIVSPEFIAISALSSTIEETGIILFWIMNKKAVERSTRDFFEYSA